MSDKELDNLFSKKLEGFKASPSPEAWKNIEAGIRPGVINWKFYFAIAASLLLVGVITVLMIQPSNENALFTASQERSTIEESITNEALVTVREHPLESLPEFTEKKVRIEQSHIAEQAAEKEIPNDPAPAAKIKGNALVPLVARNTETRTEVEVGEEVQVQVTESTASLKTVQPLEETTRTEAVIPVVFTGEKVAIATTETAPEESQRGFSFKKVIELARDFKSDNDSWSSLREAKNELLTLGRKKNDSSDD